MSVPKPAKDRPAFAEPWEARIFGIVVALNAAGQFEWQAFQSLLAEEIRTGEEAGGRAYYASWLAAAERLLARLKLSNRDEVDAIVGQLRPGDRTVRHR